MMVPFVLLGGLAAGWALGKWVLVDFLKWPDFLVPVSVVLGFGAGCLQVYRIIKKIKQMESRKS